MSSDEDDDVPLGARVTTLTMPDISDEESDPLPAWMSQHKSPYKRDSPMEDTDDDAAVIDMTADTSVPTQTQVEQPASLAGPSQGAQEANGDEAQPADVGPSQVQLSTKQATPRSAKRRATGQTHDAAAAHTLGLPLEITAGEVPIMLPEKLPDVRLLVELEPADDGATDLAGDAGAVGRIMIADNAGQKDLRIDLKGVLYSATSVEAGSSLCVVHIGPTEARVEALFSEFTTLREEVAFSGATTDDQGIAFLLGYDEDEYQGDAQPPLNEEGAQGSKGKGAPGARAVNKKDKAVSKIKGGISKSRKPSKPKPGSKGKASGARQKGSKK